MGERRVESRVGFSNSASTQTNATMGQDVSSRSEGTRRPFRMSCTHEMTGGQLNVHVAGLGSLSRGVCWLLAGSGRVQCHGGADERLERAFIDLVALMDIDGAPRIAFEAGVKETCRILESRSLSEGEFHLVLVRFAGANDPVVGPHRNPQHRVRWLSPFHLLDDIWVRLLDEAPHPGESLAPPITQLLDSCIDQLRWRISAVGSDFLRDLRRLFGRLLSHRIHSIPDPTRKRQPLGVHPTRQLSTTAAFVGTACDVRFC